MQEFMIFGGVLVALVTGIGSLVKIVGWARAIIHFADGAANSVERVAVASELIIRELSPNGGRVEHPLDDSEAKSASVKDLLLDLRVIGRRTSLCIDEVDSALKAHVKNVQSAVERVERMEAANGD